MRLGLPQMGHRMLEQDSYLEPNDNGLYIT